MQYKDIWEKYTVSSILILPIFSDIIKNLKTRNDEEYSIHSLFYNCGLINCYLYRKSESSGKYLYLLFEKDKLLKTELFVNKPYETLLDLLLNCKYFVNIYQKVDNIIIKLEIDDIFSKDIEIITKSNYSKVSNDYKSKLLLEGRKIKSVNDDINYLILKNIPAKIVHRSEKLEKTLQEILEYNDKIDGEYFVLFKKDRETLVI
jgi:hypothetical protein